MRRTKLPAPTDEEILAMDNVTVDVAARYVKQCGTTLKLALKQGRAPFGFAAQNERTGTWTYNISPGLLVAYKRGTLPMLKIDDILKIAAVGINRVIDQRLDALSGVVSMLTGRAG